MATLEVLGICMRVIMSGVFMADYLDKDKYKLTVKLDKQQLEPVSMAGYIS